MANELVLPPTPNSDGVISLFTGKYRFLSNFYHAPFTCYGKVWETSEHLYQAHKFGIETDSAELCRLLYSPYAAKKHGSTAILPTNWNTIRLPAMSQAVWAKFLGADNKVLRTWLSDTKDNVLIEGNNWGDRYWGCVWNKENECWEGENHLGIILMDLRDYIK